MSSTVRSRLRRFVLWPSWAAVVVLIGFSVLGQGVPDLLRYGPLLLSIVVLGLPHGAADHLVLLRLQQRPLSIFGLLRTLLPYLALAGAYLFGWFVAPQAAFLFFVVLTWFHWGQGDLHSLLVVTNARHLRSVWQRWFCVLIRGGLPMLGPLLFFPDVYHSVATDVLARLGAAPGPVVELLLSPLARTTLGVTFTAACGVYLLVGFLYSDPRSLSGWMEDGIEITLLAALFMTVDPVLAIGVYFCFWHAARHIARLVIRDQTNHAALRRGRIGHVLGHFVWQVLPTTGAALGLFGLLYLVVPSPPTTIPGIVALYLVLIAALTVPHVWVVLRMDWAEGIWTSDRLSTSR